MERNEKGDQPLREVRYVMGTLLDVTLYAPSTSSGRAVLAEAFAVAERLDGALSTYKSESDTSRFNADSSLGFRPVSLDLYGLVERSQALSKQTEGVFDITVRPLVEMWQRAATNGNPPSQRERQAVRERVGYRKLLMRGPDQLGRTVTGVEIETGGIGKGMAVDEMVSVLRRHGVTSAFINFGRSSMAAIGAPPDASGWPVVVELEEGSSAGTVQLRDETLSVSRAKGNPFVVAGVAYAHIFDPRTLMPARTIRGAAVRSASATDGEAYVKYLVLRGSPSAAVTKGWKRIEWIVKERDCIPHDSRQFWATR